MKKFGKILYKLLIIFFLISSIIIGSLFVLYNYFFIVKEPFPYIKENKHIIGVQYNKTDFYDINSFNTIVNPESEGEFPPEQEFFYRYCIPFNDLAPVKDVIELPPLQNWKEKYSIPGSISISKYDDTKNPVCICDYYKNITGDIDDFKIYISDRLRYDSMPTVNTAEVKNIYLAQNSGKPYEEIIYIFKSEETDKIVEAIKINDVDSLSTLMPKLNTDDQMDLLVRYQNSPFVQKIGVYYDNIFIFNEELENI